MRTGIALTVAAVFALALAGCAGSGTTIPGFAGAGGSTSSAPAVDPTVAPSAGPSTTAASTPAATATPTTSATTSGDVDCGGQPVTLTTATLSYTLTGDCPSVTVEGDGITVGGPAVAALTIKGSSNTINLASIGPITIGGQSNAVAAQAVDTFAITGDSNRIDSATTVTGGSFAGNDNQVHAPGGIGTVTDTGSGNTAGA